MNDWNKNTWVLKGDNVARMLVKGAVENEFDLESFEFEGRTVWRLEYVAQHRKMKDFWYGCTFEEAGNVAPQMPPSGTKKLGDFAKNQQAWMDAGTDAQVVVDADDGSLERLVTLVNVEDVTYSIELYRFAGVLADDTDFLYVRLSPAYTPSLLLAPDGGAVGRPK